MNFVYFCVMIIEAKGIQKTFANNGEQVHVLSGLFGSSLLYESRMLIAPVSPDRDIFMPKMSKKRIKKVLLRSKTGIFIPVYPLLCDLIIPLQVANLSMHFLLPPR